MALVIRPDDPSAPAIRALLTEHLEHARAHSPPESVHALDIDGLMKPAVTFFAAWDADALVGCGALLELDASHGEIKSMHTALAHRRRGVGARILEHLIARARERGYRRLSLETGSMDVYEPARALYRRYGFNPCPPFANYRVDPLSVCMTRALD